MNFAVTDARNGLPAALKSSLTIVKANMSFGGCFSEFHNCCLFIFLLLLIISTCFYDMSVSPALWLKPRSGIIDGFIKVNSYFCFYACKENQ